MEQVRECKLEPHMALGCTPHCQKQSTLDTASSLLPKITNNCYTTSVPLKLASKQQTVQILPISLNVEIGNICLSILQFLTLSVALSTCMPTDAISLVGANRSWISKPQCSAIILSLQWPPYTSEIKVNAPLSAHATKPLAVLWDLYVE